MAIDLRELLHGGVPTEVEPLARMDAETEQGGHVPDTGKDTPGFREGMWAVSPYNFDERVRRDMHLPAQVTLMDMTLREGRQVAGVSVGLEEVLEFAAPDRPSRCAHRRDAPRLHRGDQTDEGFGGEVPYSGPRASHLGVEPGRVPAGDRPLP